MKIMPLGSECYVNDALNYSSLKDLKVSKSPFNGTRILNYTSGINPIKMFLTETDKFIDNYCNRNNWQLVTDGEDVQALNWNLNLRRCHLKSYEPDYFAILDVVKQHMLHFSAYDQDLLYFVDLNDYIYFDKRVFDEFKELSEKHKMLFFVRVCNVNYEHCKDILNSMSKTLYGKIMLLADTADAKQQFVNVYDSFALNAIKNKMH